MLSKKIIIISIICILAVISAGVIIFSAFEKPSIQHPINIEITFPKEGGTLYYDVYPALTTVRGTILSDYENESAYIKSVGYYEPEATILRKAVTNLTSYSGELCNVPIAPGETNITVVVTDIMGNTAEKIVNFTVRAGPPAP